MGRRFCCEVERVLVVAMGLRPVAGAYIGCTGFERCNEWCYGAVAGFSDDTKLEVWAWDRSYCCESEESLPTSLNL